MRSLEFSKCPYFHWFCVLWHFFLRHSQRPLEQTLILPFRWNFTLKWRIFSLLKVHCDLKQFLIHLKWSILLFPYLSFSLSISLSLARCLISLRDLQNGKCTFTSTMLWNEKSSSYSYFTPSVPCMYARMKLRSMRFFRDRLKSWIFQSCSRRRSAHHEL